MPRLQLTIEGHKVDELEVKFPSHLKMGKFEHFNIRRNIIEDKTLELKARHILALIKYPDYELELIYEPDKKN